AILSRVRAANPGAYNRYADFAARLSHLQRCEFRADMVPIGFDMAAEAQTVRAGLDTAVREIQALPGCEDFLRPPTPASIRRAVTEQGTALVYLVSTPVGSAALMVIDRTLEVVWAPLQREELNDVVRDYLRGQLGESELLVDSLPRLLDLLGRRLIKPVAE